jgi:hypothetical protein
MRAMGVSFRGADIVREPGTQEHRLAKSYG